MRHQSNPSLFALRRTQRRSKLFHSASDWPINESTSQMYLQPPMHQFCLAPLCKVSIQTAHDDLIRLAAPAPIFAFVDAAINDVRGCASARMVGTDTADVPDANQNFVLLVVGSVCTAQQTCHVTPVDALQPRS